MIFMPKVSHVFFAALMLAAWGCEGAIGSGADSDAADDSSGDTGNDAIDVTDDTEADPMVDPAPDPLIDSHMDPGHDPAPDPGHDPAPDPGYDPAPDPGYDPALDPGTDPGVAGIVGDPCGSPMDCLGVPDERRFCFTAVGMFTFRSGYCTSGCDYDGNCGDGARCVYDFRMGYKYCYRACNTPMSCRTGVGYTCRRLPATEDGRTYCFPAD